LFIYYVNKTLPVSVKKTTTMNKITDIRANAHSSTFGFCLHAKPKQKTKRAWIFANARQKRNSSIDKD